MKKHWIKNFSKIFGWSLGIIFLASSCQDLNIDPASDLSAESGLEVGSDLVPGMYIVTLHPNSYELNEFNFRKSKNYEDTQAGLRKAAVEVVQKYKVQPRNIKTVFGSALLGFTVALSENELRELRKDPSIKSIVQDRYIRDAYSMKKSTPGKPVAPDPEPEPDPVFSELWNLDRIDQRNLPLNDTYSPPNSASNVTAYIIGSAINADHIEFEGRVTNVDLTNGGPGITNPNPLTTEVAGVIGGKTTGVAKEVNLVGVVSFTQNFYGTSLTFYISDILMGLDWVHANGLSPSVVYVPNAGPKENLPLELVNLISNSLDAVFEKGIAIFTNSGSWKVDACTWLIPDHPHVFTTGMLDKFDYRIENGNYGDCIDLFAPGIEILTADGTTNTGYRFGNAIVITPAQTVGVAAMYLQTNPTASPQQVYDFLKTTSTKNVVKLARSENNYLLFSGLTSIGAGVHDPSLNYYFELAANPHKVNGSTWMVYLSWDQSSIEGDRLNVYVDGVGFASINNSGFIGLEVKGRNIAPKTYQLCAPGTSQCSNVVTVSF